MAKKPEKRIVMARVVARRWILKVAKSEYRLRILYGAIEIKNTAKLLKSLRNGKIAMEGVLPLRDLGVRDEFDAVEVWSRNREALISLKDWFEKRGFETTGVW